MRTIWYDMDGTIADLYKVEDWLSYLRAYDPMPYKQAAVMHNMSLLARYLNKLQRAGYKLGIISWLSKCSTPEYDELVTLAKLKWLKCHLPSVSWDEIHIVNYGVCKDTYRLDNNDILFDDEIKNRNEWNGISYNPDNMMEILKKLVMET